MTLDITSSPRIVVVGSIMVDLLTYADPLPEAGQTVRGSRFQMGFGGKGANQAVIAHRLGCDVTLVARVGADVFGELSIDSLQQQGIDTSMVKRIDNSTTGVAPIWVQRDGTNRIIVVPGANDALTANAVTLELAQVTRADCVVCQCEIPEESVGEALRIGREMGAITILNPAPALPTGSAPQLFGSTDWVVPNEHEFELMWGTKPSDAEIIAAGARWGCGVIVTLGAEGAAALLNGEVTRRRPPEVQVTDTTGAGDAFVGGLAYALSRRMDVVAAIEIGNICGALSTKSSGTQSSFPTLDEVQRLVDRPLTPVCSQLGSL